MANIASFEGYLGTLSRWQIENTSLLSDGHDKRSNLEKSIALSLGSPRISASPDAKSLLALLSLLPDGMRAEDIMASKVPIPDIRQSQTVLVRTSLAYIDEKGRLKALSPIREYIRRVHPPSPSVSRPLRTYFQDLLKLWQSTRHLPAANLTSDLLGYLGNVNELMLDGLVTDEKSAWIGIADSIIPLNMFSAIMLKGNSPLFRRLPHLIEVTGDQGLRFRYASTCFRNPVLYPPVDEPGTVIEEGVQYFDARTHSEDEGDVLSPQTYI
jgi:hypothetical protein